MPLMGDSGPSIVTQSLDSLQIGSSVADAVSKARNLDVIIDNHITLSTQCMSLNKSFSDWPDKEVLKP